MVVNPRHVTYLFRSLKSALQSNFSCNIAFLFSKISVKKFHFLINCFKLFFYIFSDYFNVIDVEK
jgi:hypothetical protein